MLRLVAATRYVTALREGGSLPGLMEGDDDGMYVVKFRGAGQGPKALVAEIVAGQLARALDLPVPEIVLLELDGALGRAEPDPEIRALLSASEGLNAALDFLPGALDFSRNDFTAIDPDLAAAVVWFDSLVTNVDRTPRNPNLLLWHGRLWLIDHGAALYQHHGDEPLLARARRPFPLIGEHVLLPSAGSVLEADARLAPALTQTVIEGILADVPAGWLGSDPGLMRADYVAYLLERLRSPRTFAAEAEAARGA